MKLFLIFLLGFAPYFVHSQDCKLIKQKDPYTKQESISTGFIPLDGASISIDANKQEVDVLFSLTGSNKCFTDASTAAIFFAGTKVKQTQRNSGTMNCEGLFHFIFRNTPLPQVLLRKMSTQAIEKIIFTGNDKTLTTITLTPEQQITVMQLTACLIKDAPGLL